MRSIPRRVHPPGLEPGITVPKTVVISISPQVVMLFQAVISIGILDKYASFFSQNTLPRYIPKNRGYLYVYPE